MSEPGAFLVNLAIVLGVAAATTVVFQRLRQPVVFGYLLAGMVVGPYLPVPLLADVHTIQELAELGVVLLMFSLGLEFTFSRLGRVLPSGGLIALLQVSLMMWLGYTVGRLLGWTTLESVFAGAAVAISSTTIIVHAFREHRVGPRVADIVFGVLIAQDLIAIVLLAVLTPISFGREMSAGALALTVGRLVAFLAAFMVAGLLVVPRAMRFVVRLGRPETTLVACVGLCFGCAALAHQVGYSVALGAFVAGALVAESGEQPAIERLIEPVRDMFAAIFFVAVGMLIDPSLVGRHLGAVMLFIALVVVGQVVAVTSASFLTGHGLRTSIQAGMSLAQIGEFSYIFVSVGAAGGATREFLYPVVVAVSAVTTILTPLLIRSADPVAAAVDRRLPRTIQTFAALYGSWVETLRRGPARPAEQARVRRALSVLLLDAAILAALVFGAVLESRVALEWIERWLGLSGFAARAMLVAATIVVASPFVFGMVRTAGALGQALAARSFPGPVPGRLDHAAAPRRAMVVTIQLATVLVIGVLLGVVTQPILPAAVGVVIFAAVAVALGIGFWKSAANLKGHARAGAEVIVAAIGRQARAGAAAPAGAPPGPGAGLERVYELVPGLGSPVPVRIERSSPAAGRTLGELALRGRTGATVLAIVRGEEVVLVPDGHVPLREGDVLALAGTEEAVAAAQSVLLGAAAAETAQRSQDSRREAPESGIR